MAIQKTEEYRFDPGLSKINPAELPEVELEKYKKLIEEQVGALEQRYNQPNWFNVAAGFLKPQLGGFGASLGSASEALGQTVEQQRAQMLPLAQMKVSIQQANMILGQKQKQNELFQEWRASNKPMDEQTYTRIASLGTETEVAKAAKQFWDQARARIGAGIEAEAAAEKFPRIDSSLRAFVDVALNPNADPKTLEEKNRQFFESIDSAKPPQIDNAQWNAMSRYQKLETITDYSRAQREAGMGAEASMQQQAAQAPSRLSLLGSIRDLALGVGLPSVQKTVDGRQVAVTGQQQMAALLNYFGGNNPFEVLARAAADGKLGERLRDLDQYARQNAMSPESRDQFQKLAKLLAENQVSLRNATTNPTDAASMLQATASPNIGNSQTALVSLVDLIGHSEQHNIEKYKYVLDNRIPYRQLYVDPNYLQKQQKYADEHRKIATQNPLVSMPSWYNPARSVDQRTSQQGAAQQETPSATAPATRPAGRTFPNERVMGGRTYVRQSDGSWAPR